MGQIAETLVNGEACSWCGVYLEPEETVYIKHNFKKVKMPKNGDSFGLPVICKDCFDLE